MTKAKVVKPVRSERPKSGKTKKPVAKKAPAPPKKDDRVECYVGEGCERKLEPSKMYALIKEPGAAVPTEAICPQCIIDAIATDPDQPMIAFPLLESLERDRKHDEYMAEKARREARVAAMLGDFGITPDKNRVCVDCNKTHGEVIWLGKEFLVVDVAQAYPVDRSVPILDRKVEGICTKYKSDEPMKEKGCAIALLLHEREQAVKEQRPPRKIRLFVYEESVKFLAEDQDEERRRLAREQQRNQEHAARMARFNRKDSQPFHQDLPRQLRKKAS